MNSDSGVGEGVKNFDLASSEAIVMSYTPESHRLHRCIKANTETKNRGWNAAQRAGVDGGDAERAARWGRGVYRPGA